MIYHMYDGFNYVLRFAKGTRLHEALLRFADETQVEGAWLSGFGGAQGMTIGYYDLNEKTYKWKTFEGIYEITQLQGNLSRNAEGEAMFHLHGSFAGTNYTELGGHVKDLTVGATLEMFVHRIQKPLMRKLDDETGLQLLDV